VALRLYRLNFQRVKIHSEFPREIDSFTRSHFDRDRLCSRCRRTRSLIFTVAMNARNTSSRGADYTRCSLRRGREREVQSRATSVTASSISPRAWAGVRNRALELSWCWVDAERKRELRETRARKVTFLRFSPEFLFRNWNRERQSEDPRVQRPRDSFRCSLACLSALSSS